MNKPKKKTIKPKLSELEKLLAEPDWSEGWLNSLPPSILKEPYEDFYLDSIPGELVVDDE